MVQLQFNKPAFSLENLRIVIKVLYQVLTVTSELLDSKLVKLIFAKHYSKIEKIDNTIESLIEALEKYMSIQELIGMDMLRIDETTGEFIATSAQNEVVDYALSQNKLEDTVQPTEERTVTTVKKKSNLN